MERRTPRGRPPLASSPRSRKQRRSRLGFAAYALAASNFPGGVRRAGGEGPPPNVEITLVAQDVEAAYARALDAGCTPLAPPADKPQGQRGGYVRDPYGTLVELATPL